MTALIILVFINGASVGWPHKIVWFESAQACQNALPAEVALAAKTYAIKESGCVTFQTPVAPVTPPVSPRTR